MPAVDVTPQPSPATRSERGDKRDAILRAAIETFAARGFFNAQVADVARAPASPPARSTSTSAARTTCSSRSSSER